MKTINRLLCFLLLYLSFQPCFSQASENIYIAKETLVSGEKVLLNLEGLGLYNEGRFLQDSSRLRFSSGGELQDLVLASKSSLQLYNLEIETGKRNLVLGGDVQIANQLQLIEGNLDLNNQKIFLAEKGGEILGENTQNRIVGLGTIEKEMLLDYPERLNPGNLGLEIYAEANLGRSTLRRIQETNEADSLDFILRKYELIPSFPTNKPVQVSLSYAHTSYAFGNKEELTPWEQKGNSWKTLGYYNWDGQNRKMNISLPTNRNTYLIGLAAQGKEPSSADSRAPKALEIYPNPFRNFLKITWSREEDKAVEAEIYTGNGSMMFSQQIESSGSEILLSGIPDMPAGVYVLKIKTSAGLVISQTIIHANN